MQSKWWQFSYWSSTWREMNSKTKNQFRWLLLVHFILSLWFISKQWVLFDEPDYFGYSVQWAKGHPVRTEPILDSKTPMTAVSLIPAIIKPFIPARYLQQNIFIYLFAGRVFMYIYSLLGIFVFFFWVYRKFGYNNWFFPLLLFCFDPLVFTYGMVIGSDLASAVLLFAALYCWWRFINSLQYKYGLMLCLFAALAVVTKASMIFLYPLLVAIAIVSWKNFAGITATKMIAAIAIFFLVQLFVINAAYYFYHTGIPFGTYPFVSEKFISLQKGLPAFARIRIPLPAPFIQGVDMLQQHAEWGGCQSTSTYNGIWLFDKVTCRGPLWYYYLVVGLFKLPLFIWLLIIMAIISLFRTKQFDKIAWSLTWLPVIYFLLILSFLNPFQIGIRHAIILLPFLYLGITPVINHFVKRRKWFFISLLFLHGISIVRFAPNIIAYTNELLWNKTKVYHIIRDSSLDYGQADKWVNAFLKNNPTYKRPANLPDTGKFVLNIGALFADRDGERNNVTWLPKNFEPVGNYRFNILLFSITEDDLKKKGLIRLQGKK